MSEPDRDEKEIFLAAFEKATPEERAAFLEGACGADRAMLSRVRELLSAHEGSLGPLDLPPPGVGIAPTITEKPGTQIGHYKLLQEIGQGGMGVVYMAEQMEPVRRKVALKIIKPGLDTRQVVARFEAERQALSLMDHPNIAKVLDAGTTDTGRPYFVMELVKGQPITEYCDQQQLTPRQRLELFLAVCQAIQHAHQKGIIHRDIKPSNMLVAEYDGRPVAKVIDFGVAKAVSQPLTEKTMITGFGQVVGTLEYMSPEQARVNQLDVDTRSDIYSLGVLLYELLTGSTPFDKQRLRSAAWDEILRIIREEDPPRPSVRLSDSKESLPSISAQRQTESAKLTKLIRGELDWIVMKALDKDRNRRYETVNGLAMDVERYLADEPVQACPPSMGYRLRKFVRRNTRTLATMVVLVASLVLTIVALAVSNVWVRQERDRTKEALYDKEKALKNESSALARVEVEAARTRAEETVGRRNLYTAHITLADQAYHEGHIGRALELLENQRPTRGSEDLRGFEWYYLWYSCNKGHLLSLRGHKDAVRAVAFSRDGKTLATGSTDATVKLWAAESGQALRTLQGHTGTVQAVAFSPDGKHLVSGGSDERANVWDLSSGQRLATLQGKTGGVGALAFSPNGKTLATAGGAVDVNLWDVSNWQLQKVLSDGGGDTGIVSLAFSADGKTLASASAYRQLKLWDVATGQVRSTLNGHRWFAQCVAYSPDGTRLASAASDELPVKVWDAATEKFERALTGHTQRVLSLAFSADGKILASAAQDGTVKLWDLTTGRTRSYGHVGPVRCIAFSPDGKTLASASNDRAVKLWEVSVDEQLPLLQGAKGAVRSLAFSPDGASLASAHGEETSVIIWDIASRRRRQLVGHTANPVSVVFSADGRMLASGGNDQTVMLWDVASGQPLATLRGHYGNVHALAFSPDGRILASSGNDGMVKLWNTADGKEQATLNASWQQSATLKPYLKWVYSLAFSHDGQTLAAASRDGFVRLWNVATRRERTCLEGSCGNQDSLAYSPDGKLLAGLIGAGGGVQLWDATSGQPLGVIGKRPFSTANHHMAFSRDWKTVAVANSDGVMLWDVATRCQRATLKWPVDEVLVLMFSPDRKLLAAGGWDGSIALWPTATEQDVIAQSSFE